MTDLHGQTWVAETESRIELFFGLVSDFTSFDGATAPHFYAFRHCFASYRNERTVRRI
jgi:hypothetical protein